VEDVNQLIRIREEKLNKIRELGFTDYPYQFDYSHYSQHIIDQFAKLEKKPVAIAGRIMSLRLMGKAAFFHLQDMQGKIQVYIRKDKVGDQKFELFKLLDIGDIVGVTGDVFKTRTEEISVLATDLTLLTKALRPLPVVKEKIEEDEKKVYDQFADKETRYRQRYVDLVVNPEVKAIFEKRSQIVATMREFFEQHLFIEVETPVLQPVYGGATAKPFVTHHNKLDMDLYLRIANELYLKRLIVGGFERVYEFSKDFRNEGMDRFHNPEFTQVELYIAFKDYYWFMDFVENLMRHVAERVCNSAVIEYQDHTIDFSKEWPRLTMFEAIQKYAGIDVSNMNENTLRQEVRRLDIKEDPSMGYGKLVDEIFGECVEPKLIQPTFIIDYPIEMSPLAKRHRENPRLVERFEPIIGGKEVGNAFSELNDPVDQRQRFMDQAKLRERGDDEAQVLDEDYLRALEYGLPPTAGLGLGVDRMVMLFTNSTSIRDVIFFPQMRPE
jgi:lysyl-tRNA synthetase class 2